MWAVCKPAVAQQRLGVDATKLRSSKSGARSTVLAGIVVMIAADPCSSYAVSSNRSGFGRDLPQARERLHHNGAPLKTQYMQERCRLKPSRCISLVAPETL